MYSRDQWENSVHLLRFRCSEAKLGWMIFGVLHLMLCYQRLFVLDVTLAGMLNNYKQLGRNNPSM